MLKDSSAVFYKKKKKGYKKELVKVMNIFLKKRKEKNQEFARKPCRNHSGEKETRIWS